MGPIGGRVLFYGGIVFGFGLLALVKIPCYLEAQIRSKYTRMNNDMRVVMNALESYKADHGVYPPPRPGADGWTMLPLALTTPTAYLPNLPVDVFDAENGTIGYALFDGTSGKWVPIKWDQPGIPKVVLLSLGPTKERGDFGLDWTSIYDPTNGTVSAGHIYRLGGKAEAPVIAPIPSFTYDPTNGSSSRAEAYRVKQ